MIDSFSVRGYWWLPSQDDEKKPGILTFDPVSTITLELFEDFSEPNRNETFYEIINGITLSGVKYSIQHCWVKIRNKHYPGYTELALTAETIFEGVNYASKDDIHFRSLRIKMTHLESWLVTNGFNINDFFEDKKVKVEYALPEPIICKINDLTTIKIIHTVTSPMLMIGQKEAVIKQGTYLSIDYTTEQELHDILSILLHFKSFLELAVVDTVNYTGIQAITEYNKEIDDKEEVFWPINVFFTQSHLINDPRDITPYEMVFSYPMIKEKFEMVLIKWFEQYDELKDIYNMYFYTTNDTSMVLENRLLNYTGVIESYHRKMFGGAFIDKKYYHDHIATELTNHIPEEVRDAFRDSLKSKIRYGYEYSLRKRLADIFETNREVIRQFTKNSDTNLINAIVENRNYYTHYDEKTEFVYDGTNLFRLCNKIRLIAITLFLKRINFVDEEIYRMLFRNWSLRGMINSHV